ncbi:hypothetical protein F5146DRAFT_1224971 [Armillaria mellea]|nr:hypothetical protein F5146DRAFT_1224971 [Armillaria mellea]
MTFIHYPHSRPSFHNEQTWLPYLLPTYQGFSESTIYLNSYLGFSDRDNERNSHESSSYFTASFNSWASNACSVSHFDTIDGLSLAIRLDRSIEANQSPVPLWPRKVQPTKSKNPSYTTTLKPLRKLSVAQKATFMASQNGLEVSFLKTFSIPVFRRCQDNAEQMRHFLEHEPWLDVNRIEKDKVVCLGCGCDVLLGRIVYEPGNWMHNRDECVGIESAILDSVLNTWEVKSAKSLAVNS